MLVLVKNTNECENDLKLKILPFKPYFDFKEVERNDNKDIGFIKKGLNFIVSE